MTILSNRALNFVQLLNNVLDQFHIIAFTHRTLDVTTIGKLHIEESSQQERLTFVKERFEISE